MMARKLPSDLEEEILVRVPPLSLIRFKSVCKEWNNLFKNNRFVNKNFACSRQEFMLKTDSKMYKIIGIWYHNWTMKVEVSEFATKTWKVTDHHTSYLEIPIYGRRVSLNGNLYWPSQNEETCEYFIGMLDYSKEIIKPFCILPCKAKKKFTHSRVLAFYKGDRFSVLEQCQRTREIEIWVTKKKIGNGDDVVWIKFMTITIPNFPIVSYTSSSYFVDNNIYGKSYVVCFPSKEPQEAWVYIVRGHMCKKIQIDEVACEFQSSVFVPSLITIP